MRTSRRQQVLIETHTTRQQAGELLRSLEETRRQLEAQLSGERREDVVKTVTGRSSLDAAIAATRRMIEALDRALDEARNGLADEDLDAADAPPAVRIPIPMPSPEPAIEVIAGRIGPLMARLAAGR